MSHLFSNACKKKETYQRDRTIRLQKVRHHAFRPVVFRPVVVQSHVCFVVIVVLGIIIIIIIEKRERFIIQLYSNNNSTKFAFTLFQFEFSLLRYVKKQTRERENERVNRETIP